MYSPHPQHAISSRASARVFSSDVAIIGKTVKTSSSKTEELRGIRIGLENTSSASSGALKLHYRYSCHSGFGENERSEGPLQHTAASLDSASLTVRVKLPGESLLGRSALTAFGKSTGTSEPVDPAPAGASYARRFKLENATLPLRDRVVSTPLAAASSLNRSMRFHTEISPCLCASPVA